MLHKSFVANLGKLGQNILCTPKKWPVSTPVHTLSFNDYRKVIIQGLSNCKRAGDTQNVN